MEGLGGTSPVGARHPPPEPARNPLKSKTNRLAQAPVTVRAPLPASENGHRRLLLLADIFVPDFGMLADEPAQQVDALLRGQVVYLEAVLAQPVDAALERPALANHHRPEPELPDQARAVPARRQSRDHNKVAVRPLPPGIAEGVRLSMGRGIVVLDPPVMARTHQRSVPPKDRRPNRNPAFGQSLAGFIDGNGKHCLQIGNRHANSLLGVTPELA